MSGCGLLTVLIIGALVILLFYYLSTRNSTSQPDQKVVEEFRRYGYRYPHRYLYRYPWLRNYWYPGIWSNYGYSYYYPFDNY